MQKLALYGGDRACNTFFPNWPIFDEGEVKSVEEVIRSGRWWRIGGSHVDLFEEEFAAYHDSKYGLALNNGTVALEAALYALGIGPGDEVIVPAYTFLASASAVNMNGGTVVFADMDPSTFNISPAEIEKNITPRTKAIIVVHFAGMPCDMDAIMAIAQKHHLPVIEDAAHAHGGQYKNQKLGSIGDVGCFSFQNSKNMTSGEGGISITNNDDLFGKMGARSTFGRLPGRPWYEHFSLGTNLRMTEFQGAILRHQLRRLDDQTKLRLENAKILNQGLESMGFEIVGKPVGDADKRAYHIYIIKYNNRLEGVPREKFCEALTAEGVPASTGYLFPLSKQPLYVNTPPPIGKPAYGDLPMPATEQACRTSIWMNQNLLLGTADQMKMVLNAFEKVIQNADQLRD